jgi:hypothetical protein
MPEHLITLPHAWIKQYSFPALCASSIPPRIRLFALCELKGKRMKVKIDSTNLPCFNRAVNAF